MERRYDEGMDDDVAEPEPGSVGAASGTAKCHHCGEHLFMSSDGWLHAVTGMEACA